MNLLDEMRKRNEARAQRANTTSPTKATTFTPTKATTFTPINNTMVTNNKPTSDNTKTNTPVYSRYRPVANFVQP